MDNSTKISYSNTNKSNYLEHEGEEMASWSKVRQQLQSFLSPELEGRVEYRVSSYRYMGNKQGTCNLAVDKKEIFAMQNMKYDIRWYETEQEIIKDYESKITVTEQEVAAFKEKEGKNIPEERIPVILKKRKASEIAKNIVKEQTILSKSNFSDIANEFLTTSVDKCLNSEHILFNVLAIVDRRVGKNRLRKMEHKINEKHPIVQYFYHLRCGR